MSNIKMELLR